MLLYYFACTVYCAVLAIFSVARLPEIASLVRFSPAGAFLAILALVGQISLYISPSKSLMFMVRRLALITLVRTCALLGDDNFVFLEYCGIRFYLTRSLP